MDTSSFVSPDYVLSKILVDTFDENLTNGFTKGWYYTMIFDALKEIEFDARFNTVTKDIHNWYNGKELSVSIPKGAFDVLEVYAFNGSEFVIENSVPVYAKNRYNTSAKTEGHTARLKDSGTSYPYGRSYYDSIYGTSNVLYCNIQNGKIMLSDGCKNYSHIRVVFSGVRGDLGDVPCIPIFFEDAVHDYVVERYFRAKKIREQSFRTHWMDAKIIAYGDGRKKGSIEIAKKRAQSLTTLERQAMQAYFERGKW